MIIFYNTKIVSLNNGEVNQSSLAIQGNKIIASGIDTEIISKFGKNAEIIDLQQRTILPGLTDSHLHLGHLGESLASVDCETNSIDDCLERVKFRCENSPQKNWVLGHGWNHNVWSDSAYGSAEQLDLVSNQHPILLHAKSLHASWVNSKALQLAGINKTTQNPPGGTILKKSDGTPTGILLENATRLVEDIIPQPTIDETIEDLKIVQEHLWQLGITSVHDFDTPRILNALQSMYLSGSLSLRVRKNMPVSSLKSLIQSGIRSEFGNDMIHMGSIKLFADGALGPQSAALKNPYEKSTSSGKLLLSQEEIVDIGIKAIIQGWSLAIHAIGDLANQTVLKALKAIRDFETANNLPHFPHRIEHVQLIDALDQANLKNLDIIASVQPLHCTSDMFMVDKYWGKRGKNAYPFATLQNIGIKMIFGSDAPVESANPFFGIHAAVTRRKHDGRPDQEGWYPDQKINLAQALAGYTLEPAKLSRMGNRLGQIKPGYYADLIVLPDNPFNMTPQELFLIKPDLTMSDGKIVFSQI